MEGKTYSYYAPASIKQKKMQGLGEYLNKFGSIQVHGRETEQYMEGYKQAIREVWEFIGFELHVLKVKKDGKVSGK